MIDPIFLIGFYFVPGSNQLMRASGEVRSILGYIFFQNVEGCSWDAPTSLALLPDSQDIFF